MSVDFLPTGIATGLAGSITTKEVTTVIGAGLAFVPAAGFYDYYAVGANVVRQVQDSGGNWNTVTAAGVGGTFCSDGTNMRFFNQGGGNQNVTLIKIG